MNPTNSHSLALTHVGIHESKNRNAGDTLLFEEVRRLFDLQIGSIDWARRQLWEPLDANSIDEVNIDGRPLVIGGGGLLLRDQAGADASASGWQWNSTPEAIRQLKVPVVVFGIGYNRFRGQEEFDAPFTEHLNALVEQSVFFGLRNTGSIRAVSQYLSPELAERLVLQPCPTVFGWHLHNEIADIVHNHVGLGKQILRANVAFDRPHFRFGRDADKPLAALAKVLGHAAATGWEVRYTAHKDLDLQFLPYLDAAGVSYEVDDVTDAQPREILETYARCDLAVGLRGHAQMVPFGLRRPILSVVSHDKLQWFLDDIDHPEWGVEMLAESLVDDLCDRIDHQAAERELIFDQLGLAQDRLWAGTKSNLDAIARDLRVECAA